MWETGDRKTAVTNINMKTNFMEISDGREDWRARTVNVCSRRGAWRTLNHHWYLFVAPWFRDSECDSQSEKSEFARSVEERASVFAV